VEEVTVRFLNQLQVEQEHQVKEIQVELDLVLEVVEVVEQDLLEQETILDQVQEMPVEQV
jgi:hypothetical protein